MTQRRDGAFGRAAVVRKRKYDGTVKLRWEGKLLASPVADWHLVLHDPDIHRKFTGGSPPRVVRADDALYLHCFSAREPLTVLIEYDDAGQFAGAKCDAALPATLHDGIVDYVDLDLDLIVEWDFSTSLRDRDTFQINRERMQYPDDVVGLAWEGISFARRLVDERVFPFDAERLLLPEP